METEITWAFALHTLFYIPSFLYGVFVVVTRTHRRRMLVTLWLNVLWKSRSASLSRRTVEGIKQFYIAVESEEWKFDVDHHTCDPHKRSFAAIPVVRWTGYKKRWKRRTLLSRVCMGVWTNVNVVSLCALPVPDRHVYWSRPIYWLVVLMYDEYRWWSILIYHRIGRSGRFVHKGVAVNFLAEGDVRLTLNSFIPRKL